MVSNIITPENENFDADTVYNLFKNYAESEGAIVSVGDGWKNYFKLYNDPPIDDFFQERISAIIEQKPDFFENNDIMLPENYMVALFDHYYGRPELMQRYGNKTINVLANKAKVWIEHIRFYLIEYPDQAELNHAVAEFKTIMEGRYKLPE